MRFSFENSEIYHLTSTCTIIIRMVLKTPTYYVQMLIDLNRTVKYVHTQYVSSSPPSPPPLNFSFIK